MKKLLCFIFLTLGLLASCGGQEPEEYPELLPTPYDEQVSSDYAEPLPLYIPGFDHYEVSLTIDPTARTVSGISITTFTNRTSEPLDIIVLRVYLNGFNENSQNFFPELMQNIFRHGFTYGYMDIEHASMNNEDLVYHLAGTVLVLYPQEPISPGETVQLVLQYNAYIPMIAHRIGANSQAMWFGMFLPILATIGDDGWVIPEYYPAGDPFILEMASFEVEIITPADYIVAGTGVTADEITLADTKVTRFVVSNARSFSFAISPYFIRERITSDSGDIHLYYYTTGLPIDIIIEILSAGMEHFSGIVGQYPFDHIRIVETDMFISGAAFSNVIFMDTAALAEPDAEAIIMMLGEQWFSNIVSTNSVLEPWLDEGLVRYIMARYFYDQPMEIEEYAAQAAVLLSEQDNLSLSNGLGTFDDWQSYYQTHHIKGMLMFYALNNRMGDELFWVLIREYFQAFYFQIAAGMDFVHLAEEIYGGSLEDFFTEWLAGGAIPPLYP